MHTTCSIVIIIVIVTLKVEMPKEKLQGRNINKILSDVKLITIMHQKSPPHVIFLIASGL